MKQLLAETAGTFAIVFCGTGAVILNEEIPGCLGLTGISLIFGVIIAAMIYLFGRVSGAHFNPAVTISLTIAKRFPKSELVNYISAQLLGAILASSLLLFLFPENQSLGGTRPSGSMLLSFFIEWIMTFLLMLTILAITSRKVKKASALSGIVIGAAVFVGILIAGPISGGSFNPARSIAPVIVSGNFAALEIYILAPITGALCAMFIWTKLIKKHQE